MRTSNGTVSGSDWQADRIGSIISGTNPTFMAELDAGFAVIADSQFLPGYCVLLPKRKVKELNDFSMQERVAFLRDMTILGDVIAQACAPVVRLNYDILGNTDTYLHAHVFPRYAWEDPERLRLPIWLYPDEYWTSAEYRFDREKYRATREAITDILRSWYPNQSVSGF